MARLIVFSLLLSLCLATRAAITATEREAILKAHNDARALESASDMHLLVWDTNLAQVAQDYANKCIWDHNSNRKSDYANKGGTTSVGENLYVSTSKNSVAVPSVTSWVNEKSDYTYSSNSCKSGAVCGHYTQVVWADSTLLGCGIASCSSLQGSSFKNAQLVVCNYASAGNFNGRKPYTQGSACSACDRTAFPFCVQNQCSKTQSTTPIPSPSNNSATRVMSTISSVALAFLAALGLCM